MTILHASIVLCVNAFILTTVLVVPGDGGSGSGLQQGSQALTYAIYQIMGVTSSHSRK